MVSCSPRLETWCVAEADLELLVLLPYYYHIWHLTIFHKWLEPDWIWEPWEFCNRSLIDTEGQLYYRCRQDSVCSISHTIRRNQTASLCNITLCTWRLDFSLWSGWVPDAATWLLLLPGDSTWSLCPLGYINSKQFWVKGGSRGLYPDNRQGLSRMPGWDLLVTQLPWGGLSLPVQTAQMGLDASTYPREPSGFVIHST